ncbi:helix-turn-helix domain-containing protein [Yersinia sp. Marseille-Q5920]|nr:helix-turn-helix transcriptional regulator [Yersinia sp. Marseille-Q5920]
MRTLTEIAEEIKGIRQQQKLKQSDMRLVNGMTQQQVSKFEKGGDINLSTLLRILDGFNLEMVFVTREQARELRQGLNSISMAEIEKNGEHSNPWQQKYKHLED